MIVFLILVKSQSKHFLHFLSKESEDVSLCRENSSEPNDRFSRTLLATFTEDYQGRNYLKKVRKANLTK